MYSDDKAFEESFHAQVVTILRRLSPYLVEVSVASAETDKKRATDFEVKIAGSAVAVRLRRSNYHFRDLTLRSHRSNGMKTELAKIKEGYASHYFYGWLDANNKIAEWMLIDLDKVRAIGLLDKPREEKANTDGTTSFISIAAEELRECDCMIVSRLKDSALKIQRPPTPTNPSHNRIQSYLNKKYAPWLESEEKS